MNNFEEILEKLLDEQIFLKDMQKHIVGNYDIMMQNQQHNANNHESIIKNQSTIIKNQEIIVNNQINIVRNQKKIVQNQIQLDVIIETQTLLLNLIRKLNGSEEKMEETNSFVATLIRNKTTEVMNKNLEDPISL